MFGAAMESWIDSSGSQVELYLLLLLLLLLLNFPFVALGILLQEISSANLWTFSLLHCHFRRYERPLVKFAQFLVALRIVLHTDHTLQIFMAFNILISYFICIYFFVLLSVCVLVLSTVGYNLYIDSSVLRSIGRFLYPSTLIKSLYVAKCPRGLRNWTNSLALVRMWTGLS
jgi:hypothetical protein